MTIPPDYRPTTADVAAYIKNRTVDDNNNFFGDFTNTTVVTQSEVDRIINQAGEMVLSALRYDSTIVPPFPPDNVPTVKALIALFSACFVEVTKFSEQVARQVSPYPYLKDMFDGMLAQKQADLGIVNVGGSGGGGLSLTDLIAGQYGRAIYQFPDEPMVNWDSAF
jgi:hypothetical protein